MCGLVCRLQAVKQLDHKRKVPTSKDRGVLRYAKQVKMVQYPGPYKWILPGGVGRGFKKERLHL